MKKQGREKQMQAIGKRKKGWGRVVAILLPTDTSRGGALWHCIRQGQKAGWNRGDNLLAVLFWWLVSVGLALLIARVC